MYNAYNIYIYIYIHTYIHTYMYMYPAGPPFGSSSVTSSRPSNAQYALAARLVTMSPRRPSPMKGDPSPTQLSLQTSEARTGASSGTAPGRFFLVACLGCSSATCSCTDQPSLEMPQPKEISSFASHVRGRI